jgi:hypothetical protein
MRAQKQRVPFAVAATGGTGEPLGALWFYDVSDPPLSHLNAQTQEPLPAPA